MAAPSGTKWNGASMWVPLWTLMFTLDELLWSPRCIRRRSTSSNGAAVTQRAVSALSLSEMS